jgi:leucyl aminopeptidase
VTLPELVWSAAPPVECCGDRTTPPREAVAGSTCVVVGMRPARSGGGVRTSSGDRALAAGFGVDLDRRLTRAKATGKAGELVVIDLDGDDGTLEQLVAVGLGAGSTDDVRRAGAAAARRSAAHSSVVVAVARDLDAQRLRALTEGWLLASYRFSRRSTPREPTTTSLVICHASTSARQTEHRDVTRGVVTARAVHRARDLANTPSNEKSPADLVAAAQSVAEEHGLQMRVWDRSALQDEGFGGLLAVGAGSAVPPALVQLSYEPKRRTKSTPHIVLVGKGITFDSGGLSLKPADFMTTMKTDMSGSAAVLATMGALADLGVAVRVTALLAIAENMPGAASFRPGDVITHYGGRTSEVFNTDAEGRLVLADALAYADAELAPDVLVDIATLTGAASVGLGRHHGALYATDAALTKQFVVASKASGEKVWPMPLVEEYRDALQSEIADLSHIERDRRIGGGSITAALFLREFVGERRWVHLDIAGPGRSDADRFEISRGGTGFGTRVLLRWLEGLS